MSIDISKIILFGLCLFSIAVRANLTNEEIQNTKFFELLGNPESDEQDVCKKVSQILNENFQISEIPQTMFDAFKMYLTAGYNSFGDIPTIEEVQNDHNERIRFITNEIIDEYWGEKLVAFDSNELNTLQGFVDKLEKSYIKLNKEMARIAIITRSNTFKGDHTILSVVNNVNSALVGYIEELKDKETKQITDIKLHNAFVGKYNEFSPIFTKLVQEKAKNFNNNLYIDYISEAINFEIATHNNLIGLKNKLDVYDSQNDVIVNFASKFFAFYRVIASNDRQIDSNDHTKLMSHIWSIIGFFNQSELKKVFEQIFAYEIDITTAENQQYAFLNNVHYGIYNIAPVNINDNNADIYIEQYSHFRLNLLKTYKEAMSLALSWTSEINDTEFTMYVYQMIIGFVSTNPAITDGQFSFNFDSYLDNQGVFDGAMFNVLKFYNGMFGKSFASNESWKQIKMATEADMGTLKRLFDNSKDGFKNKLDVVTHNSGKAREDLESYSLLTIGEFNTEWYGRVNTTTTESKTINQKIDLKAQGLTYGYDNVGLKSQQVPYGKLHKDDGLTDSQKKRFNQKEDDEKFLDELEDEEFLDEEEEVEEIDEDQFINQSSPQKSDNKIHEHEEPLKNVIYFVDKEISSKAEDQLLEPNLRKRLEEGLKIDGFDEVVYVNVIPAGSPCFDKVKEYLAQKNY